jgi:hypothetical protein
MRREEKRREEKRREEKVVVIMDAKFFAGAINTIFSCPKAHYT